MAFTFVLTRCGPAPTATLCEDIGQCSGMETADWMQGCTTETAALQASVTDGGCGAAYEAYTSCAAPNYVCSQATTSFPGCTSQRAALDGCLEQVTTGTACDRLAAAQADCGAPTPDSGAAPRPADAGIVLTTCSYNKDCQALCTLTHVANVCTPAVSDLVAAATCSVGCP